MGRRRRRRRQTGGGGIPGPAAAAASTRAGGTGPAPAGCAQPSSAVSIGNASSILSTTPPRCVFFLSMSLATPFLPKPLKLSPQPCFWNAMLIPDHLAASVPHVISDVVFLPNTFRLPGAAERKHPEHFIDQVEHALPKDRDCGRTSTCCGCRTAKK